MEIIIEDGKIVNLDELMKESPWIDMPDEDSIMCHAHRIGYGTIGNDDCLIGEFHHCNRNARVFITKNKEVILDYKFEPPYMRDSHVGKTFYRTDFANQDLRSSGPIEYNASIPYQNQSI